MRKIIHIDMDAFYASVEQRDDPTLRGKPVAVGGSSDRGVVAAASYEARMFGIHSAMPSKIAARKCPQLVFIKPRFDVYKTVSTQIREIFLDYTDLVEPLSLDEAYLDVTTNKKDMPSATIIAKEIKSRIKSSTGLTASAGISINKFLAKTASDIDKPDGLTLITPDKAQNFVDQLPIHKFFGVGKVTAKKMHALGITRGAELKKWKEYELTQQFGKVGKYYYNIARCIDNRPINPNRQRKSIGAESTYEKDLTDITEIRIALNKIASVLVERVEKSNAKGKTLTLKVKNTDFKQITRSKTADYFIDNIEKVNELLENILDSLDTTHSPIRLLGLSISNMDTHTPQNPQKGHQLTLGF